MELSSLNFGVSDEKLIAKRNTEKETEDENMKVVGELVNTIKAATESRGYATVAVNKLPSKFNLKKTIQKNEIVYLLKSDENIITQKKTIMKNGEALKEENESATTPIFYRYVSKEQKQSMGFKAHAFQNLNGMTITLLEEAFNGMKDSKQINAIMYVFDYLVKVGAMKDWIEIHAISISSAKGARLDDVLFAMKELADKKLLVAAKVPKRKNGTAIICRIAKDSKEYDELVEYARKTEKIPAKKPFAKERRRQEEKIMEYTTRPEVVKEINKAADDGVPLKPNGLISDTNKKVDLGDEEQANQILEITKHIKNSSTPIEKMIDFAIISEEKDNADLFTEFSKAWYKHLAREQNKNLMLERANERVKQLEEELRLIQIEKATLQKLLATQKKEFDVPKDKYFNAYRHYVDNGLMDIMGMVFNGIEMIAATPPRERYNDYYIQQCKADIGKNIMRIVSQLRNVSSEKLFEMIATNNRMKQARIKSGE